MANIKLEEIVASWLEMFSLGKAEYTRIYQLGILGIRALNIDVTGQMEIRTINLDNNLTGKLPDDFINEIQVHVCGDSNAGLLKDNTLGVYEQDDDEFEEEYNITDTSNPTATERARNTGGIDWIGRYRIDKLRNRIYVNTEFCYSQLTLKYLKSSNATRGGEWLVDELAREALEAYITWKHSLGRASAGPYEKAENRRNFLKEKRKLKVRMLNVTRGQMQDTSRSSIKFKTRN